MPRFIDKIWKKLPKRRRLWQNVGLFAAAIFIVVSGIMTIWLSSLALPDFSNFEERKVINSTKIYDRTGEVVLYDINKDVRRTSINFEDMGENIKRATIAVEDSEFYSHSGIRIPSIVRATLIAKLTGKKVTGGSTITQQLVKNALLTPERSLGRKIKEWVLAIKMEQVLSKDKILELYLNEVPYGGTLYGIEEASRAYFNKKPADLTLAEAAYLASIPQSPTLLSPYGKNRQRLEERKNYVLSRMYELDLISKDEYERARAERVAWNEQRLGGIKAPHFVFFIKEYLASRYGSDTVERGGLKVITTLDWALQQKAEEFVIEGALENQKNWDGENAALVAIEPRTGQILTMVGSRDYFDTEIEGAFNVAVAERQPGSSFKPFIYATAFNKGFTDKTVLFDLPTEFHTGCNSLGKAKPGTSQEDCYMPDNYDGKFRGPMSLRDALAQSINVPAVKLFYLAGLDDSLKVAEEMGISTLTDVSRYGLTLVIGGGEVTLLDMTSAYSVLANNGVRNAQTGILRVENLRGEVLEEFSPSPKEVLPKNTALILSDILSDNAARVPTFGANSSLVIKDRQVAAKTGTTNNNRDAWTIGYTPSLTVGVWVGNNGNKPMKKGGAALAGPIWNRFMAAALESFPPESFESPDYSTDIEKKPILRGLWRGGGDYYAEQASLTPGAPYMPAGGVHTILYWVDRKDILGPPPKDPASDPQYANWEAAVQNWWGQNSYGSYGNPYGTPMFSPTTGLPIFDPFGGQPPIFQPPQ